MFTFSVCDNNPAFAKAFAQKVRTICAHQIPENVEYTVAAEFGSAQEVLTYLQTNPLNVLFLDIDMPGMNGFELAQKLNEAYPDVLIVFVSAYDEFVYSSFEYAPFRFLRKSHLNQELPDTVQKIIAKCLSDNQTLTFSTTEGDVILRVKDICYVEGERNDFTVHTRSREAYRCRGTISAAAEMFEAFHDFYRIHVSFIVNMDQITRFDDIAGAGTVTISDGQQLSVSRRNMADFKKAYMAFSRRRMTK